MYDEEKFDFAYLDRLIHETNTKEIILDHDICFEDYEVDFYEGGIELDIDDLVIDGNGNRIGGEEKSRIFLITGKNITLKNIFFGYGYAHIDYDNQQNSCGGAIKVNYNASAVIKNCELRYNFSEYCGGAISNNGELHLEDSSFEGNSTDEDGGAIVNNGVLSIIESSFYYNYVNHNGGAIFNKSGLSILTSSFERNESSEGGGAIFNKSSLSISDSAFISNESHNGGAIYNCRGKFNIAKSELNENNAIYSGGAIRNCKGELTVIESTFNENAANVFDGGAIENWEGDLTIIESAFNENTSNGDKTISSVGGSLTKTNCNFG